MFHRTILGVPGGNLDTYFTGEAKTKEIFMEETPEDAFAVVEGVMGLYDGLGGILEEGSTYHLAKAISLPVILVIDAHGMGRTILPLIQGLLSYDKAGIIKGVILNRVSKMFYASLKELIETELSIEVLGCFTEQKELHLESRHLGLKLPEEKRDLKEQVCRWADSLKETVSIERILAIGGAGEKDAASPKVDSHENKVTYQRADIKENDTHESKLRLAIARDEAFCFYYKENLEILEQLGAELCYFSPVNDVQLPEDTDGIYLGGGYPETYRKELAENLSMKESICEAAKAGKPIIAECGGFMYVCNHLVETDDSSMDMLGLIDTDVHMTKRLSMQFGYVTLNALCDTAFFKKNTNIRAHEFHYSKADKRGDSCEIKKYSGKCWNGLYVKENIMAGYPHFYFHNCREVAERFVDMAEKISKNLSM